MKCRAKATSRPLAHSLPPRWRPKPHHLEILSCHLRGSFPPRIPRFLRQRPRAPGSPGGTRSAVCLAQGNPAHLVIPAGESPPPVHVTPGREFPPLESTRGRESPPILEAQWIPSAVQLGEPGEKRTPGAGACGPGQGEAVGGGCGDPQGRGRPGLRLLWLRTNLGAAAPGWRGGWHRRWQQRR